MMHVYAKQREGTSAIWLSKDHHMDTYLSNGYDLYDENHELIATPEKGFLNERPTLEKIGRSGVLNG